MFFHVYHVLKVVRIEVGRHSGMIREMNQILGDLSIPEAPLVERRELAFIKKGNTVPLRQMIMTTHMKHSHCWVRLKATIVVMGGL